MSFLDFKKGCYAMSQFRRIYGIGFLKQFKLLPFNTFFFWYLSIENFNIAKLLICNTHYTDISILWKEGLDTFYMNSCVINYIGFLEKTTLVVFI